MNKIFIATSTFGVHSKEPIKILEDESKDFNFNPLSRKLTSNELIKFAHDSNGIVAGTELYTKEVIDQLPHLKVISRLGIGMDNIDQDVAKKKGIYLFKTQTTPAPAVAELVLGFMLDLARKINYQNNTLPLNMDYVIDC